MTYVALTNVSEVEPHTFVTEASDLGLRPGEWPQFLTTNLGNGLRLVRSTKKLDADGDLLWVTYHQAAGCIRLRIFND